MSQGAYPALDLWRRCLRAHLGGQQARDVATWTFDALWRAACAEAWAKDNSGIPALHDAYLKAADQALRGLVGQEVRHE